MKKTVFLLACLLVLCACTPEAASPPPDPIPAPAPVIPAPEPVPVLPEPEPEPIQEPEPIPEPEPEPEPVWDESWFDGALFVGDSIMEGVRQYVVKARKNGPLLGSAQFLTATTGISLADLLGEGDGDRFRYGTVSGDLSAVAKSMEAKKLILLLGLNDLAGTADSVEQTAERYIRLLEGLRAEGFDLLVLLNPPKVASTWLPQYAANRDFGNRRIDAFVTALTEALEQNGYPYADTHAALSDDRGYLPDAWCRDGYVHLNDTGAAALVDAVYEYLKNQPIG